MVQASWLALQSREEVTGVKHLRIALVAALMRSDRFTACSQFDAVDMPLDANRAKGKGMGQIVTILIEGQGLVFIDLGRRASRLCFRYAFWKSPICGSMALDR